MSHILSFFEQFQLRGWQQKASELVLKARNLNKKPKLHESLVLIINAIQSTGNIFFKFIFYWPLQLLVNSSLTSFVTQWKG